MKSYTVLYIYSIHTCTCISLSPPPPPPLGSLSWCGDVLCSGSRDNMILQWDPRLPAFPTRRLLGHAQEVCGLRWSPNRQHLASGGNDNKVSTDFEITDIDHCVIDIDLRIIDIDLHVISGLLILIFACDF